MVSLPMLERVRRMGAMRTCDGMNSLYVWKVLGAKAGAAGLWFKKLRAFRGTWMAQSAEHPTLHFLSSRDLRVMRSCSTLSTQSS